MQNRRDNRQDISDDAISLEKKHGSMSGLNSFQASVKEIHWRVWIQEKSQVKLSWVNIYTRAHRKGFNTSKV